MACLIALIAFFMPRLAIILLALFSNAIGTVVAPLWAILGFLFMPYTLLAYTLGAHQSPNGAPSGVYLVLLIVAILADLGVIGGSQHAATVQVRRQRS